MSCVTLISLKAATESGASLRAPNQPHCAHTDGAGANPTFEPVKIQTLSPFIRLLTFALDEVAEAPASRADPPR